MPCPHRQAAAPSRYALALVAVALGCNSGGGSGKPGLPGTGMGGASGWVSRTGPGAGNGSSQMLPAEDPAGTAARASPPAPRLPGGGGQSNTPLAPGCTPASANRMPHRSAASAPPGAGQTVQVQQGTAPCACTRRRSPPSPATTIEYLEETVGRADLLPLPGDVQSGLRRTTPTASNSIGWPHRPRTPLERTW